MKKSKRKHHLSVPQFVVADDLKESTGFLLKLRLPWLIVGLAGGFGASYLISRFEGFLAQDVRLAFFVPVIVYLSDAIGTQTETIYIRNVKNKTSLFHIYLVKECSLGIIMGGIFGLLTFLFTLVWLKDATLSLSVSLAMAASVTLSPLVALTMAKIFQTEHQDPAVGAGPLKTIAQDIISIGIYFFVASAIIFR